MHFFGTPAEHRRIAEETSGLIPPPGWLIDLIEQWSISLRMDRWQSEKQPTRKQAEERLAAIAKACKIVCDLLADNSIVEIIDPEGSSSSKYDILRSDLAQLARNAAEASRVTNVAGKDSILQAGRGRAGLENTINPQTYCAILIAEIWMFFRNTEIKPGAKAPCKCASLWWAVSHCEKAGEQFGSDDTAWTKWRHHFKKQTLASCDQHRATIRQTLTVARNHAKLIADETQEPPDMG